MIRIAAVVVYLVGMLAAVISLNADGSEGPAFTIWAAVSVLLGAGTGRYELALLSLLAIPIAIPFGIPDDEASRHSDPVFPVGIITMYYALFSSGLALLAAAARRGLESRLQRRRALRNSGTA